MERPGSLGDLRGAARVKQVSGIRVGMTLEEWRMVEEHERQREASESQLAGHVFALAEQLEQSGKGDRHPFASRQAVEEWFDALFAVAKAKQDAEQRQ